MGGRRMSTPAPSQHWRLIHVSGRAAFGQSMPSIHRRHSRSGADAAGGPSVLCPGQSFVERRGPGP